MQSMPEVLPELQVPWAQFDGRGGLSPKHSSRIYRDIIAESTLCRRESKVDVGGHQYCTPLRESGGLTFETKEHLTNIVLSL